MVSERFPTFAASAVLWSRDPYRGDLWRFAIETLFLQGHDSISRIGDAVVSLPRQAGASRCRQAR